MGFRELRDFIALFLSVTASSVDPNSMSTLASDGSILKDTQARPALPSDTRDLFPNAAAVNDKSSPVYFLHIPKTAGTTVHNFLTSRFGPENICPAHLWHQLLELAPSRIAGYDFIWGHFYSYLFRHVPVPMRYVTFLRDPVERALSHYGHIMLYEGHYLHRRAKQLGDFSSYLRDPEMVTTMTNFQVRALALDLDPSAIASTLSAQELADTELERRLETAVSSASDDEMLRISKHRLEQMCFVGITERLDESVALLCDKFHWQPPAQIESHNVNGARVRASQISATDLALLREMNKADYALYEFATRRFADELDRPASARRSLVAR